VTLDTRFSVRIEKTGSDLGGAMNAIREWLDSRKIEPVEFKTLPVDGGIIALNIRIRSEDEAYLFDREFV
jgi:hypothetical protein